MPWTGLTRPAGWASALALILLATSVILSGLLAQPPEVRADPTGKTEFEAGSVLVKFKPLVIPLAADLDLGVRGLQTISSIPGIGVRKVAVPQGGELEAVSNLLSDPLVEYAEPNYLLRPHWVPDDARYSDQWNLRKINMEAAWDISRGSSKVMVAVIDTGLYGSNPDAPAHIYASRNECTGEEGAYTLFPNNPHGTHVAGIIAANTNNGIGVAGIAPDVWIIPVKVDCGADNKMPVDKVVAGIKWAVDKGATVVNLSLGSADASQTEQDGINYALGKGALVVASAGNEYEEGNPVEYPASYPGVISVGASSYEDTHAYYSETNPYVSVVAPGGNYCYSDFPLPEDCILSTYGAYWGANYQAYAYKAGTSMAAPHVSGLAALILSVKPALTAAQVTNIITSTAVDLGTPGKDDVFGWGRIDAYAALSKAQSLAPPAEPGPGDWPVPGFAPSNSRHNSNESYLLPPLKLKWTYDMGGYLHDYQPQTSPMVANNQVYVRRVYEDNNLYALDEATGSLKWSFKGQRNGGESSLAVGGGFVYLVAEKLQALEAATGEVKWTRSVGRSGDKSPPVVANGVVYVVRGGLAQAFDGATGSPKWTYPSGGTVQFGYSSPAPVVADGVVYIAVTTYSLEGGPINQAIEAPLLHALDAGTGSLLWSYPAGVTAVAVADGVIYIKTSDFKLLALDANNKGALKWMFPGGLQVYSDPGAASGSATQVFSGPAVANGLVYVTANADRLLALDALTGSERWSFTASSGIASPPTVANGVVYAGSGYLATGDKLYVLSAATGQLLDSYTMGGQVRSSPVVANGALFVMSTDNKLYVFEGNSTPSPTPTATPIPTSTPRPVLRLYLPVTTKNQAGW